MPCLLLDKGGLYKTVKFKKPVYIGDPINAVKIFNEKAVDELIFLDITASSEKRKPDFKKIEEVASEAFMPFAYGGGISELNDAKELFRLGVEKVILNTAAATNHALITEIAALYGNQAVVVSVDVKKNIWGKYEVVINRGAKPIKTSVPEYCKQMEKLGAGELMLNSVDKDGTWEGYDIELLKMVTKSVRLPVIACGGAGSVIDFSEAVSKGGASALAAGSMMVFQRKGMGVLINFPKRDELDALFAAEIIKSVD